MLVVGSRGTADGAGVEVARTEASEGTDAKRLAGRDGGARIEGAAIR
jgi:hypothetical protein